MIIIVEILDQSFFIFLKEKLKEKELKEIYEKELLEKDKQIQELLCKQNELEKRILKKSSIEFDQKHDNEELYRVKRSSHGGLQVFFIIII